MLINELPDDCLLVIFSYLNDLDDLINSYKVCVKWSDLVNERTRKVKYLIGDSIDPTDSFDYVHHKGEKPIDGTVLSKLFGNLEIFDYTGLEDKSNFDDIIELVRNQKCLKGINYWSNSFAAESIIKHCNKLEMISSNCIEEIVSENGASIKQLHLWDYTLDEFKETAHNFQNLERLFIYNAPGVSGSPDNIYDGPIIEKLKIVELSLPSYDGTDTYYGFQFMDSCPNLQSAHISMDSDSFYVDESIKHRCLQDLVIDFNFNDEVDQNELQRLFLKYPNLKHLGLRDSVNLVNEHIEQLVKILPNLVFLYISNCPGVTQSAANYVQDYCKRYGRSIKFYFDGNQHEIESDWPQLSTKKEAISLGFDFMKHCFLKNIQSLPTFLVPIDY